MIYSLCLAIVKREVHFQFVISGTNIVSENLIFIIKLEIYFPVTFPAKAFCLFLPSVFTLCIV